MNIRRIHECDFGQLRALLRIGLFFFFISYCWWQKHILNGSSVLSSSSLWTYSIYLYFIYALHIQYTSRLRSPPIPHIFSLKALPSLHSIHVVLASIRNSHVRVLLYFWRLLISRSSLTYGELPCKHYETVRSLFVCLVSQETVSHNFSWAAITSRDTCWWRNLASI